MNRSFFALFVALLIHLIFFLIFIILATLVPDIKNEKKPEENKIKVSLKEMPKKDKKSGEIKKEVKQTPVAPPMPKGKQLKEIVKKPPIKFNPKNTKKQKNELPINPPKPSAPKKPQKKVKPIPPEKPYIPVEKVIKPTSKKFVELRRDTNTTKKKTLKEKTKNKYAWMSEDRSQKEIKKKKKKIVNGSSINQNIKELYGDEFGELTPGQQKYIIDNQEIMRRITQEVLNRVARVNLPRDLNVNRTNIIEFYLHTNGDMTDFKFIKNSGYYVLDDTTKETIEYAYSRYPRPSEKTLIRYNVFYNLARY